jgi:hypothetical protein
VPVTVVDLATVRAAYLSREPAGGRQAIDSLWLEDWPA